MLKLILITLFLLARYADADDAPKEVDVKFEAALSNVTAPRALSDDSPYALRAEPYLVSYSQVNWYQAQLQCAAQKMVLVSIDSQTKWTELRNWLMVNNEDFLSYHAWTSGTDLASEGRWAWQGTGRTFTYRNWATGEPNNYNDDEDCLSINLNNGLWNDAQCTTPRYYICEDLCTE